MAPLFVTRLIIFTPSTLYRAAWSALMSNQPNIVLAGAIDRVAGLEGLAQKGLGTTVLVDLSAPQLELAGQIKAVSPEAGLLFLVQSYELAEILPLLQSGVLGCVSRDATVGELARAIIAVSRGEIALPPHIAAQALAALARGHMPGDNLIEPLSAREIEVLSLLAQGLTNKDIAQTLILSVRTIEAHLRNIYGKLGVRSRTEAALWAVENGYSSDK